MKRNIMAWIFERIVETLLAAHLLIAIFGPTQNPRFRGQLGELFVNGTFVVMFDLMSAYIFSTIVFGILYRETRIICHVLIMTTAFIAHSVAFLFFFSGFSIKNSILIVFGGACIVAAVSAIANIIFNPRQSSHGY